MNTKLKCLLLDDELPGLAYLKLLCEQIDGLEVVKAFNNPLVFMSQVETLDFDLCILDIEMPDINGLQIARLLRHKPVIFTTAYKEHAENAFELDAVDYVRKPIQKERLEQAVQKAFRRIHTEQKPKKTIQLNTSKGKALLLVDDLVYIKTSDIDSRDKLALLKDGSDITLKNISFEKLLELLPNGSYARVNKKEMIALRIVKFFSHNEITTHLVQNGGTPLTLILTENYRSDFIKLLPV